MRLMGVWIDILNSIARGDPEGERSRFIVRLLSVLLDDSPYAEEVSGQTHYQKGPLTRAIDKFISSLYGKEKAQAEAYKDDLRDYIIDGVVADIEESIRLIELCWKNPQLELEEIVTISFWKPALCRSLDWKRNRAADLLRSMMAVGIPLPSPIITILGDRGIPKFKFDEVANALSLHRIKRSWQDLRNREQPPGLFCIVDTETDSGVAAEGVDYGSITISRVTLKLLASDAETSQDLEILSETLGPELTKMTEEMHLDEPGSGYRPIAWHRVFWDIDREYDYLQLILERRDPECDSDDELTKQIVDNYPDVTGKSRPFIYRRRKKLYNACKEKIQDSAMKKYCG